MKFKLYPFQVEGRDFLLGKKRLCLFDELGTGKSVQVLAAIEKRNFKKILLIAPAGLLLMWEQMIIDVLGKEYLKRFTLVSYNYIQLPRKKRRETDKQKNRRLRNNKKLNGLLKGSWELIVADEFQKAKSWTSQTTRGWRHLIKDYSGYIWMLTGTPATRTGSDYYVYLKTLNPEKWGTYSEFTKEMCECVKDYWSGGFKFEGLKQQARSVIREAFFPYKLRRLKKDVLDQLPRKIHKEIPVKINAKIVKECIDAKSKYNLNGDKIDPHVAVILRSIGLGKVTAALEFISTCDEPLVIFAVHTEVIEKIRDGIKRLGFSVATVTGKDSAKAKNKAVTDFQSGKIDHIICNYQAGGVGITLTRSKHCILAEQCWNPADMIQGMGRIDRLTQKAKCIQFTLLTGVGTLDTHIKKVREQKYEFMKEVMGDEN